ACVNRGGDVFAIANSKICAPVFWKDLREVSQPHIGELCFVRWNLRFVVGINNVLRMSKSKLMNLAKLLTIKVGENLSQAIKPELFNVAVIGDKVRVVGGQVRGKIVNILPVIVFLADELRMVNKHEEWQIKIVDIVPIVVTQILSRREDHYPS